MTLNANHARSRRVVAALATTAALAFGGSSAIGGEIAAADSEHLTARPDEPVAVGLTPVMIRLMVAVATCSEIYPPGTDITNCVKNLY